MRRTAVGPLLASLVLAASSVSAGDTSSVPGTNWLSGCPDTMVIANVDCGAGPVPQLDERQRIDMMDVDASVAVAFAPWCDGRADITRYGCPVISTQSSASGEQRRHDDIERSGTHSCITPGQIANLGW